MQVQLPWVWISLQFGTKHPIDLGYYDGLEWSYITLEYCPQHYCYNGTWLGFGQRCMSLLSLVFLRGFRDAQSERRLSICLEFLSLTSSTFVRAFLLCGNWHIWDFVAALVLCYALALWFYVSILHLCRLPGYCAPFGTDHGIQAAAICATVALPQFLVSSVDSC